jgi:hypothetical protein
MKRHIRENDNVPERDHWHYTAHTASKINLMYYTLKKAHSQLM